MLLVACKFSAFSIKKPQSLREMLFIIFILKAVHKKQSLLQLYDCFDFLPLGTIKRNFPDSLPPIIR